MHDHEIPKSSTSRSEPVTFYPGVRILPYYPSIPAKSLFYYSYVVWHSKSTFDMLRKKELGSNCVGRFLIIS